MNMVLNRMISATMLAGLQAGVSFILALVCCGSALGVMLWAREGFAPGGEAFFISAFKAALFGLSSQLFTLTTMLRDLASLPPESWASAVPSSAVFIALAPACAILLPRHLRLVGATSGWASVIVMGMYLAHLSGI